MLNKYYDYKDYGKLKLVCQGIYGNGQYPLELVKNGEVYTRITVCLENEQIEDNELIIKNYSENEGMLEWCLKNKLVEKVVRTVKQGYAEFPICKMNDKLHKDIREELRIW